MKNIYVLFSLMLFTASAWSQNYSFKTTIEPYEELKAAKLINDTNLLFIEGSYSVKIPFKFKIMGKEVDFADDIGIIVFRKGYIFDRDTSFRVIQCFNSLLDRKDSTSTISYSVSGIEPNRVLKFQWNNMGLENHVNSDFINVQLWLYEKTGSFSVHFGSHNVTSIAGFTGEGLGPSVGVFRFDQVSQDFVEKQELIGNPESPLLVNQVNRTLSGMPKENTVYTFSPPVNTVSVAEVESRNKSIRIYPNPTANILMVNTEELTEAYQLKIYSITGQLVKHETLSADVQTVSVAKLKKGIYIVQVVNKEQQILSTSRLVISK